MSPERPADPLADALVAKLDAPAFHFDKAKDTWVCPIHGETDDTGWVPCYTGCDEGYVDEYEDDPINNDPGDVSVCEECRGNGGFRVCGQCNADNPDVEF